MAPGNAVLPILSAMMPAYACDLLSQKLHWIQHYKCCFIVEMMCSSKDNWSLFTEEQVQHVSRFSKGICKYL